MPKVLVVDDEAGVREAIALGLAEFGTQCETAGGGRLALMKLCERTAAGRPYDAIILDIVMPDVDGWSVLKAIRSNPLWRDLKVIVLTGRANSARDMVRAAENDSLLVEKDADFLAMIAQLLRRYDRSSTLSPAAA